MTMRKYLILLAAIALAGCESLPASGPTVREITAEGAAAAAAPAPQFALIEMNADIAARMEGWPRQTFADIFPEPGGGASFRISVGDVVKVTLWESLSAGLSGGLFAPGSANGATGATPISLPAQVVTPSGAVTVPFAGRVPVKGRTPAQVETEIVRRLAGKAINPQAIVVVEKPVSNQVSVIGDAAAGGSISLAPGIDRITEVIAATGGVNGRIDRITVTLARGDRVARLPLKTIFDDPRQNLRLSPGDILTVAQRPYSFTTVGATSVNARREFGSDDYFLSDALGATGGVLDARGDPAGVYVMRLEDTDFASTALNVAPSRAGQAPVIYHFDMDAAETFFLSRRFRMRDKDIIYVANAPTVEVQKLLDIFRAAAAPVAVIDRSNRF